MSPAATRRFVVLDDDPTGTQTVTGIPVLTAWDPASVDWAMRQPAPGFFVLTNTRSLDAQSAAARTRQVAEAVWEAALARGVDVTLASRGDSTLRGHFPVEVDVLADVAGRVGRPVDGTIVVPAYIDAGRTTVDAVHRVDVDGVPTPVGQTEFARDATFSFASSALPDWIEEKTAGRVSARSVHRLSLGPLRGDGSVGVLRDVRDGTFLVADAERDDDLRRLVAAVAVAEGDGARFAYHVGPSYVRARLGQTSTGPLGDEQLGALASRAEAHGLVVVGSHVRRTTRQLEHLLAARQTVDVELDVEALLGTGAVASDVHALVARVVAGLGRATTVLHTSREPVVAESREGSLALARAVSATLVAIVRQVLAATTPAYVIAKGGITSSDLATGAVGLTRAWARGSLLQGIVSLWEPVDGRTHGAPYVVFAGNVGDDGALSQVVERMERATEKARTDT